MDRPAREPAARLDAIVDGRVQGVGFRYFVLGIAADLDLRGWVANEPDGAVRCVAEGRRADLETFVVALHRGPPGARVDEVRVTWGRASGTFERFTVRSGGHSGD